MNPESVRIRVLEIRALLALTNKEVRLINPKKEQLIIWRERKTDEKFRRGKLRWLMFPNQYDKKKTSPGQMTSSFQTQNKMENSTVWSVFASIQSLRRFLHLGCDFFERWACTYKKMKKIGHVCPTAKLSFFPIFMHKIRKKRFCCACVHVYAKFSRNSLMFYAYMFYAHIKRPKIQKNYACIKHICIYA